MDELDLPEIQESAGGLIDSLFSNRPRTGRQRPASATPTTSAPRRPTVSFQEPERRTESRLSTGLDRPSSAAPKPPPPTSNPASTSSRALDSLFSSTRTEPRTSERQERPSSRGRRDIFDDPPAPQPVQTVVFQNNDQVDELKKELSNLKYEKEEDKNTINELRRENGNLREEHEKEKRKLVEEHKQNILEIEDKHREEIRSLRQNIEDDVDVVRNVKRQEDQLVTVQSRLENVDYTLNTLKETISSLGNYNEPVNRIVDLADKQIQESMIMLHKEQQDFDIKHKTVVSSLENELEKMMKDYVGEISAGRVWVQEERDRLESERRAFQEEQQHILGEIEKQKELLDQLRTDFITKEHDLLVRVVNERASLDEERRLFQRQRDADIYRMRAEAQHLEKCLIEVEQSHLALEKSKMMLEQKAKELNQVHQDLVQYENNYWKGSVR